MTGAGSPRSSRATPIAIGVAVAIALVGGYWFMAQGPGRQLLSPPGSTVLEAAGDADQTTPAFSVREGWAIEWESSGTRFAFAIRGDRDFGTVISIDEPGNGTTSPTGAGSFHIEVDADGPWSIKVTQGE